MKKKSVVPPTPEQPEPTLTKQQIMAAATNNPALATDEFTLGGRTFKVLDLGYDEYLDFTTMIFPAFEAVVSAKAKSHGVSIPGISIPELNSPTAATQFIKFCKDQLITLGCIVCNMQAVVEEKPEDRVTPEWVKKHSNPMTLAKVVFKQIEKNKMIQEFGDFFVPLLGLLSPKPTQPEN